MGLRRISKRLLDWLKAKMEEPENGCGKCAVCHHVCGLLEKREAAGSDPDEYEKRP